MGDNLPREAGEGLEVLKSKKMYHTNTVHSSQNVLQKEGLLNSGMAFLPRKSIIPVGYIALTTSCKGRGFCFQEGAFSLQKLGAFWKSREG